MTTCPECQAPQEKGALFCNECGVYLAAPAETRATARHVPPFTDQTSPLTPSGLVGQGLGAGQTSQYVTFIIPCSGRRVRLPLKHEIRIGRATPAGEDQPALDLTDDSGAELGVSRSHALIRRSQEGVVLLDLNSTNGTALNSYRLPPELPYPLQSGSEVRLGQLVMHVFLE